MTKDEIIAELKQKEDLKAKTEMIFHQLTGQISLLRDLLQRESQSVPPKE
jgi:hypothetical protein